MLPDFFTEKLARKPLNGISPREGKDMRYPNFSITGPKVMLVNEMAGSGGDLFPWYFKHEKIGPVIGARTWGGLIGISRGIPMLDGGGVTAPEFGIWSLEQRDWIAENHGVDPDVPVEQRPDLEVKGIDPQLEKAIELINIALKKEKPFPARPKYPPKGYQPGGPAATGDK
jgi:tricorn protease